MSESERSEDVGGEHEQKAQINRGEDDVEETLFFLLELERRIHQEEVNPSIYEKVVEDLGDLPDLGLLRGTSIEEDEVDE